jgi:hypothetical protein
LKYLQLDIELIAFSVALTVSHETQDICSTGTDILESSTLLMPTVASSEQSSVLTHFQALLEFIKVTLSSPVPGTMIESTKIPK